MGSLREIFALCAFLVDSLVRLAKFLQALGWNFRVFGDLVLFLDLVERRSRTVRDGPAP